MRALRLAHPRLLEQEGQDEEAVETFLALGAPGEALPAAERCNGSLVERLDTAVVERWLAALADVRPPWSPGLTAAELMLALLAMDVRPRADAVAGRAGLSETRRRAALVGPRRVVLRLDYGTRRTRPKARRLSM